MTLDEAIKHAEEVVEENQRVVDTGIIFDDVTIGMLYCDDTEVIEEHLANYQMCAEEHRQLAEWLRDYKRLKEQESCEDCISREAARDLMYHKQEPLNEYDLDTLPSVNPKPKTGWRITHGMYEDRFWCSCGYIKIIDSNMSEWKHCPVCGGTKMVESQERSEE